MNILDILKDIWEKIEDGFQTRPPLVTFASHPFGRGAGTATGVQYCTEYTQSPVLNTDETVESVTVDPGITGKIIELEFGLTGSFAAAASITADLKYTWQARSIGQPTWVALAAQVTKTDINTTNVEETYSGYFGVVTTAGDPIKQLPSPYLLTVPFEARLVIQSNEASQAQGKTKNSSYFRVTMIPD